MTPRVIQPGGRHGPARAPGTQRATRPGGHAHARLTGGECGPLKARHRDRRHHFDTSRKCVRIHTRRPEADSHPGDMAPHEHPAR